MRSGYLAAVAATALLCAAGAAAGQAPAQTAPTAVPLSTYGALPSVSDLTISPDGHQFAFLTGAADQRQLQVRNMADLSITFSIPVAKAKVRAIQWAGEDHLILLTSATAQPMEMEGPKREYLLALEFNIAKHTGRDLLPRLPHAMPSIESAPTVVTVNGKPQVVVEDEFFPPPSTKGLLALYRIDIDSGSGVQIALGGPATVDYLTGPDGEPVARADYYTHDGAWVLYLWRKGEWVHAFQQNALLDTPSIKGLGPDGKTVLVDVHGDDGWSLTAISIADGATVEPPKALDGELLTDPRTGRGIGGVLSHMDGDHYAFVDPADQKVWDTVAHAFAGEAVTLASWSDDRKHIIAHVEGSKSGIGFYAIDLTNGQAKWLADEYDNIGPENVAEKRIIDYKAADGMKIPAFLTLPRGKAEKNLPLIVLPHGGPAAADDPGFDWWAQALASRGYAVLQPQFRGSTGLGDEHLKAGYGQWGRKMQTDLSDGVRDLVKKGMVDPKRVCIMGASYGGYAALAAATFDPSTYRCAVSLAGPSDLHRMLVYERTLANKSDTESLRFWERFMGAENMSDPALDDISPASHAKDVTIPVMIIQGQDDTVVPFEQSKEMADALRGANKRVEFVVLKSEDHWLSRGETRQQMLEAAVAFVEKENPPG